MDFCVRLKNEDTVDLEVLRRRLVGLGYESVYQVETPGEFAIRGGIVDIFALTEELPYRIELWGDEVDPSVLLIRTASVPWIPWKKSWCIRRRNLC